MYVRAYHPLKTSLINQKSFLSAENYEYEAWFIKRMSASALSTIRGSESQNSVKHNIEGHFNYL